MALLNSMNTAFTAMDGFKKGFDVVSNNIANVNSIAFKGSRMKYLPNFSTVLQRSIPISDASNSNQVAMQVGNGIDIGGTPANFAQGALESTEQETDLAIVGDGFFKVSDKVSNTSYLTRVGNFRKDNNNNIVTYLQGYHLQGLQFDSTHMPAFKVEYSDEHGLKFTAIDVNQAKNAPTIGDIKVDFGYKESDIANISGSITGGKLYLDTSAQTAITNSKTSKAAIAKSAPSISSFAISDIGEVYYTFNDNNSTKAKGGTILLTNVRDPQALTHEGDGLFSGMDAAGVFDFNTEQSGAGKNGIGYLRSKTLEMSNVDLTKEFSETITLQRGFQAVARIITVSDEILTEVVNLKR